MITVNGHELKPTIFPDKTSQIWHLPEEIAEAGILDVDWRFEQEREFFDLLSLRLLNQRADLDLYIPYLPYGRQDKLISNNSTFNLHMFGVLLETLKPRFVETIDAHNPRETELIGVKNIEVRHFHQALVDRHGIEVLVFPDQGAQMRYAHTNKPMLVFKKEREEATGKILGHKLDMSTGNITGAKRFLIIDDICDGGATFISVAKRLRAMEPLAAINLFVTHGIFSHPKGRRHLLENDIDRIFTTDSLIHNRYQEGVMHV